MICNLVTSPASRSCRALGWFFEAGTAAAVRRASPRF
nr:MAG TPA_asm: hypothetical protein [Caudoviricetes sp.]